jgi:uncharacterized membrane protein
MSKKKAVNLGKLVLLAMLTAIVVVLQFIGAFVRFGPFSISLVLMPIVVGAALLGAYSGAWLGFVFGAIVLLSGDAGVFLAINPLGAIVLVFAKGVLSGVAAGLVYKVLARFGKTVASLAAATICPLVNTGIFVLGIHVFFIDIINEWALAAGFDNTLTFVLIGMIGANFLVELMINIVLNPVIVRVLQYRLDM